MPSHAKDLTTATIRDAEDDQVGNLTSSQALSENESCMSPGAPGNLEGVGLGMRSWTLPPGVPGSFPISPTLNGKGWGTSSPQRDGFAVGEVGEFRRGNTALKLNKFTLKSCGSGRQRCLSYLGLFGVTFQPMSCGHFRG